MAIKKIAIKELKLGMYVQELHGSWLDHPFWKTSFLLEDARDLEKIRASGISHVSIDLSRSVIRQQSDATPRTAVLPPLQQQTHAQKPVVAVGLNQELNRAHQICESSRQAVIDMFAEARMGKAVSMTVAAEVVDQISRSVERQSQALIALARLKTSDNYTYMHSVAVCAMMVSLARELDMSEDEIRQAGEAGLLHDVGKMAVPEAILNKPGKLTDAEFAMVKNHPEKGAEILLRTGGVSAVAIDVCLHHHEKFDGLGYPEGLSETDISRFARMGAICDVYDAITSNRPYKSGWGPADSLSKMAQWQGHFDPLLLQAFVKTIGIYPIGSLVRLKSQRLAVVIDQDEASLLKPVVKVFFSAKSKMPLPQTLIRLSDADINDEIEGREPVEKWNFPYLDSLWLEGS